MILAEYRKISITLLNGVNNRDLSKSYRYYVYCVTSPFSTFKQLVKESGSKERGPSIWF